MVHQLTPPFFVDITCRITPTLEQGLGPWLGLFWASYMQTPYAGVYYFRGRAAGDGVTRWFNSQSGLPGSVVFASASQSVAFPMPEQGDGLLYGVQLIGYRHPVYGGKLDEMLLAFMFRNPPGTQLSFAFNPSGGGPGVPAWDFQLLIGKPKADYTYEFQSRTAYKKFEAIAEILALYRQWQG